MTKKLQLLIDAAWEPLGGDGQDISYDDFNRAVQAIVSKHCRQHYTMRQIGCIIGSLRFAELGLNQRVALANALQEAQRRRTKRFKSRVA